MVGKEKKEFSTSDRGSNHILKSTNKTPAENVQ